MGTQRGAMVVLGPNDEREDRGRHVDIDYAKATTQTNYAKLRARATVRSTKKILFTHPPNLALKIPRRSYDF